jgi:hypothetical protein
LALADSKASFQQTPQIATQSASSSSTAAIMAFNKIGSGSSSSSYASSSTAKDPYEYISSNNINPLQPFGTIRENPLASRTNTNNVMQVLILLPLQVIPVLNRHPARFSQ